MTKAPNNDAVRVGDGALVGSPIVARRRHESVAFAGLARALPDRRPLLLEPHSTPPCCRIAGVFVRLDIPRILTPLLPGVLSPRDFGAAALLIRARLGVQSRWRLSEGGHLSEVWGRGLAALHFAIDKALTLGLQRRRPDLLFLHAAVFVRAGQAVAVLASPGGGKSTTALAALEAGLDCSSDELAPIDPKTLRVWPYPRALVLKHRPAKITARSRLRSIRLGPRWYLPLRIGAWRRTCEPPRLRSLVLLERSHRGVTAMEAIAPSHATAHVYSHCLNPLAHPRSGLTAVRQLVTALPCYRLESAEPELAVALLHRLLTA